MKLSLRLIACLVVSISLGTFVVARSQVRSEKLGLRTDLARRAEILTESLQENVEPVLQQGDRRQLHKIVGRFGDREHLAGVAVYDGDAKLLAASAQLGPHAQFPPNVFTESKNNDKGAGGFAQVGDATMYVYALPMHHFADVIGVLVTFHDATYIEAQSSAIWRDAIWHDAAQVLLIVLITYVMMRWSVMGPIARMSQWMKDLRTGKAGPIPEASGSDLLGDLTSEATQLAQHLNEARMSAKEEARLREAGDSQDAGAAARGCPEKIAREHIVRSVQPRAVHARSPRKGNRSASARERAGDGARADSGGVRGEDRKSTRL